MMFFARHPLLFLLSRLLPGRLLLRFAR